MRPTEVRIEVGTMVGRLSKTSDGTRVSIKIFETFPLKTIPKIAKDMGFPQPISFSAASLTPLKPIRDKEVKGDMTGELSE